MEFVIIYLFFIESGESIYNPPHLKFILWGLQYNKWVQSNLKLLYFIDVANPF